MLTKKVHVKIGEGIRARWFWPNRVPSPSLSLRPLCVDRLDGDERIGTQQILIGIAAPIWIEKLVIHWHRKGAVHMIFIQYLLRKIKKDVKKQIIEIYFMMQNWISKVEAKECIDVANSPKPVNFRHQQRIVKPVKKMIRTIWYNHI